MPASFLRRRLTTLALYLCLAGAWQPAATAVSLQDLLSGGTMVVGNARFGDWQLVAVDATSGALPDLAQVTVVPLASDLSQPGVQFLANNQLATTGIDAIDLIFTFRVSPLPGANSFTRRSLGLTGVVFGGEGGTVAISQEASDYLASDLGPALVMIDSQSSVLQLADDAVFAANSGLTVTMNVFAQGLGFSILDTINVSSFTTRFQQTGPVVLAGDYNDDGAVDAADYTVWRDHFGAAAGSLPNDVDGGPIGPPHYARWNANFAANQPGQVVTSASVPEPCAAILALLATVGMAAALRPVYSLTPTSLPIDHPNP